MIYDDPWPCEDAGHCLADQIRDRLAEVEAERDFWKREQLASENLAGEATRRLSNAEARLAEVEADRGRLDAENMTLQRMCPDLDSERHRLMKLISVRESDWEATKARLAAVLALCDERQREIQATWGVPIGSAGRLDIADVRAAAAGDDRG